MSEEGRWPELDPPLREYERQQGGYWLYGRDPFGADRVWVPIEREERR